MRKVLLAVVLSFFTPLTLDAQSKTAADLLLEEVRKGIACSQVGARMNCKYSVGRDLEFEIDGVGERNSGTDIRVRSASPEADYGLVMTVGSVCVGVAEGYMFVVRRRAAGVPGGLAMVWVSTVTGRVYPTMRSCEADGRR